jgi:transcriptional regulator with XRE-family HTH domain/quercetin dioxygenase-like cupin family protein
MGDVHPPAAAASRHRKALIADDRADTMFSMSEQADHARAVGLRLRRAREETGLSLRELARRLDLSASALSQIETGKSRPSVKTLYAIVSELRISLDELFENPSAAGNGAVAADVRAGAPQRGSGSPPIVQRAASRATLELDSGVVWERLTAAHDPDVDFLCTTYNVGGASSSNRKLLRHSGREYGVVLSGELEVTVGFETYRLKAGDSVSFDSQQPHLLVNPGDVPARTVWFVIGRRESDPRNLDFPPAP